MAKTIADWKKTYRPRKFSEVIGQDEIVGPLREMCKNGSPTSNAFLFAGTKGTGKTTNARLLAAGLNCEHLSDEGEPCGKCATCNALLSGEGDEYSCAGFNVDSVRSLKDRLSVRSNYNWRVIIMDEAQEMNSKVSSEFLKILEEPPAGVVFAFCTTRENKIERALRSRMTRYQTKNVPVDVIVPHIKMIADNENIEYTDDDLSMVARGAEGSVRLAIGRLQEFVNGLPLSDPTVALNLATAMVDGKVGEAIYTIKKAEAADALNPREVLEELREFYSNLLMAQHCEDWQTILGNQSSDEYVELIEEAADNDLISHAEIIRGLSACSHAVAAMDRGNSSNAQLEATVVRILEPEEDRLAKRFVQLLEETLDDSDGKITINVQNVQEGRISKTTASKTSPEKAEDSSDDTADTADAAEDTTADQTDDVATAEGGDEEVWPVEDAGDADNWPESPESGDEEASGEQAEDDELVDDADDAEEEEESAEEEGEEEVTDDFESDESDASDEDDSEEVEEDAEEEDGDVDESEEDTDNEDFINGAIEAILAKAKKRKSPRIFNVLREAAITLEEDDEGFYISILVQDTMSDKMLSNIERIASEALESGGYDVEVSADFAEEEEE